MHTSNVTPGRRPISELLAFAIPYLIANVLQSLNGSINSMWIGHFLGETAFAASTNINSCLFLLLSLLMGVSMAAAVMIGQCLGAQRLDEARRVLGTSAAFVLVFSSSVALGGYLLAEQLLHVMQAPAAVLAPALAYLHVILLVIPPFALSMLALSALRATGDAKTPLAFMCLAVALDLLLNPLLIFGFGGMPGLGITGSALATLIAQSTSCLSMIVFLQRRGHVLMLSREELRRLKVEASILRPLLSRGTLMGMQSLVIATSGLVVVIVANRFGAAATAASGAVMQLWNYVQMLPMAIGAAVSALSAMCIGAGRWDRVTRLARTAVATSLVATALMAAAVLYGGSWLPGLFLPARSEALTMALHGSNQATWSFVLLSIPYVLFGVVRAAGAALGPLLILMLSMWVVRFSVAIGLETRLGLDAVWWSFPASAAVLCALSVVYYLLSGWRAHTLLAPASAST